MGIFDGCLLACDIDGTLSVNGVIPRKNIEAVERFVDEGGHFSIATGRSIEAFNQVLKCFGGISLCIVFNGAAIYDYSNDRVVYEKILPNSDKHIVEKVISLGKNIGVEIHSGKKVFTLFETQETIDHQTYEELNGAFVKFDDIKDLSWNKTLFTLDNHEELNFIKEYTSKFDMGCSLIETSAFIDGRKRLYFEMLPLGVDKGIGLDKLREILNIESGRVFAIGDYYNDLEMIEKADIGAAVADSPEDIKQIADYVTVGCAQGAVADFINYLEKKIGKDAKNGLSN